MLYYKATAGCGVGFFGGVSVPASAPPPLLSSWVVHRCCRSLLRPSSPLRHPLHTHWSHSYSLLRRPAPPLILLNVSYPRSPRLARPSSFGRLVVPYHSPVLLRGK